MVGNVPFHTAVLVALRIAVLSLLIGRLRNTPGKTLEIGTVITFLVLTALTFMLSQAFMERWPQPLSNAGIFLVTLVGALIPGRSCGSSPWAARPRSPAATPIDAGRATIHDAGSTLSIVCYWVIPITLLGLAAVASRFLPDRMRAGARRKGALSARRGTFTQRPGRRVEVDADPR